ncbi:MAG: Flp family type IVb pilin [Emcibacter sp.]|nr:Flp family type IVb pilin [Emcibacter sp.]
MNTRFITRLLSTEKGATAIEYGLIAALIAVATIGSLTAMSDTFIANFDTTSSNIAEALGNENND